MKTGSKGNWPRIEKPCPKRWEDLVGDDRRRFCSACQLHVQNLDALSPRERVDYLRTPGRKCGAYALPAAPAVQSPTAPRRGRPGRLLRPACAALAFLVALATGGCVTTSRKDPVAQSQDDKTVVAAETGSDGKQFIFVGEIIEERPLWKRILWPWGD